MPVSEAAALMVPPDGAAGQAGATGRQHAAGNGGAAERRRGGDGRAGAELRRAGDETGGKAGHEHGKPEHGDGGQDGRGRLRQRDLAGRPDERAEQRRADADHDRQHHQLDAGTR